MKENTQTTSDLIVALLKIGATFDVDSLFDLIVQHAPKLVGARECSIFWRDGIWRKNRKIIGGPDKFFRRATYQEKLHLIGVDYYEVGYGLTGWVAKHRKTLNIADITDAGALRRVAEDLNWSDQKQGFLHSSEKDHQKAFLAVPVTMENECVGVIRIAKTIEPNAVFLPNDVKLLEAFANNISDIVRRAEEAEQKRRWDDLYLSGIDQGGKFTDYMQEVANNIPKYLSAEACSIFLVNASPRGGIELRLSATTRGGALESEVGKATYGLGEGLTGWVAETKRSLRLSNPEDPIELDLVDSTLKHKSKYIEGIERSSPFLACPLQIRGRVLGVIRVSKESKELPFSSSDQRFLEYFCRNLTVLLQNYLLIKDLEDEKDSALTKLKTQTEALKNIGMHVYSELSENLKRLSSLFPELREDNAKYVEMGPISFPNKPRSPNSVFIGIPFSGSANNVFKHGIRPALEELKLSYWHGKRESSQKIIMQKVFEAIHQSSVAIVDISDWNANVLFELGALYALNRKVILLKREESLIPVDLAGLEYVEYVEFDHLADDLRRIIPKAMHRISA